MGAGHVHHDYGHGHDHDHDHSEAPRAISGAIAITAFFMVVEFLGGWFANSLALITDAAHMLTDIGALLLSLFALWISRRPKTLTMSFGYHRAEILGALTSGLLIWGIAGILVYEAILRLKSPPPVQGSTVFVIASIGLIANLISMWMLHGSRNKNMNVRAAYLHVLADLLGSFGAIVAGAVLWLTDWRLIDPIITIVFSALMLISSWDLVKEAVIVLMESTPAGVDAAAVKTDLQGIAGVREAHDLHIWTVSSGRLALSVHLISDVEAESVLAAANDLLKDRYRIIHTTIQIEHPDRFKSERCYDCAPIELKPAK